MKPAHRRRMFHRRALRWHASAAKGMNRSDNASRKLIYRTDCARSHNLFQRNNPSKTKLFFCRASRVLIANCVILSAHFPKFPPRNYPILTMPNRCQGVVQSIFAIVGGYNIITLYIALKARALRNLNGTKPSILARSRQAHPTIPAPPVPGRITPGRSENPCHFSQHPSGLQADLYNFLIPVHRPKSTLHARLPSPHDHPCIHAPARSSAPGSPPRQSPDTQPAGKKCALPPVGLQVKMSDEVFMISILPAPGCRSLPWDWHPVHAEIHAFLN